MRELGAGHVYEHVVLAGAIIYPAATSLTPHPASRTRSGFDSIEDFHTCIDDPELDVEADAVLVLRGCGPKGSVAPRLRPLALVQTG